MTGLQLRLYLENARRYVEHHYPDFWSILEHTRIVGDNALPKYRPDGSKTPEEWIEEWREKYEQDLAQLVIFSDDWSMFQEWWDKWQTDTMRSR